MRQSELRVWSSVSNLTLSVWVWTLTCCVCRNNMLIGQTFTQSALECSGVFKSEQVKKK